ncbi:MAG: leucine-rich repeat domain-containing protein, partial [Clostridia bacterium]|nr:leucine-rich repeat domain-containing protein [Clostridia bacterium]
MFTIQDGVLIKYNGNEAFVTVPDGVTGIGTRAFWNISELKTVKLPDGVDYIGDYAFYSCYQLQQVEIPDSVKIIGEGAFADCYELSQETKIRIQEIRPKSYGAKQQTNEMENETMEEQKTSPKGAEKTLSMEERVAAARKNFQMSGAVLTKYIGTDKKVEIPDWIKKIAKGAFKSDYSYYIPLLQEIIIPDS